MNQAGIGFFAAVRDAARQKLGPAHPCTQALALASDGGDPATMAKAQDELGRLEPGELAELMAMAHRTLREDTAAILRHWRAPTGQRSN